MTNEKQLYFLSRDTPQNINHCLKGLASSAGDVKIFYSGNKNVAVTLSEQSELSKMV
jgi:hypothetical protein